MQIKPIITRISENIQAYRSNRLTKLAKQHIQIHDTNAIKNDTLNKLYEAQTTLGNYARNENVKIDIYSGDYILDELTSANTEKAVVNKLAVSITDLSDKNKTTTVSYIKLVPDDTSATYLYEKQGYRVSSTSDEPQTVNSYIAESHEDSFLRNLYRTVSKMVNNLKVYNKK